MNEKKKTVLIVDDTTSMAKIAQIYIEAIDESGGIIALRAHDGEEAYAILTETPSRSIDLVISDVEMPKMDGIELAKRIKSEMPGVSVILMTSNLPEYKAKIDALGIPVLAKPFNTIVFKAMVVEMLFSK